LEEGSDNELSLHANRGRFNDILIRPHFLINDVSTIDNSITLFGTQLTQPIYLSVINVKNCFIPNGEQETPGRRNFPAAASSFEWTSPPAKVNADYSGLVPESPSGRESSLEVRRFGTLEEYTRATHQLHIASQWITTSS
jgi:FMN-dependent dehydrogenase